MRAGKLDRRVEIWRQTPVDDALSAQPREKFTLWKKVWAELAQQQAAAPFDASALRTTQAVVWNMRPVAGLKEQDQIRHGGRTYRITGILETERRRAIQVTTEVYE